jgi:hypothetical protein
MFRIRRIHDDTLPINREALAQVQEILRRQFKGLSAEEIDRLPAKLKDGKREKFRPILKVADDLQGRLKGFALMHHAPDRRFCFLNHIAISSFGVGGGVGGALYERLRDEAHTLEAGNPLMLRHPRTDSALLFRARARARVRNRNRSSSTNLPTEVYP